MFLRLAYLTYHLAMGVAMILMAWDMWVEPHPQMTISLCRLPPVES